MNISSLRKYYNDHPLRVILFAAFLFRMLAVIFSKGFGWIDDQFLIIEIAQSWVDGVDYYHWLPNASGTNEPKGFMMFYTGLHYLLFQLLEWMNITGPQAKMFVVRLLHALWSLLIVFYGYKITARLAKREDARLVGWLIAVFWMFPFLSVRNLVEFVCIPLLMNAVWLIVSEHNTFSYKRWIWIGILFGLAFDIRMQTALFTAGIGLVLLFRKKIKATAIFSLGFVIAVAVVQGTVDWLSWGEPFIQLKTYVTYNLSHSYDYTTGPWYNYLLFIPGILLPPAGLFLVAGFLLNLKKNTLILFVPVMLFLIFHSIYPNKQERFVTTVIPFIMINGVIGWRMIVEAVFNPVFVRKLIRGSWILFWIVNFILLIPVSTAYSKKARVESMSYLSRYEQLNYFIIEDVNKNVLRFPPQFYLGKWLPYDAILQNTNISAFKKSKNWSNPENQPGFVIFIQPDNLESRVKTMKTLFPGLVYETTIEPGMIDKLLHWLNPVNDNQNIYLYRNTEVIKEMIVN